MYSWLNSVVSNRRMTVIVNDRYYAAYDVAHLFLYLTSYILVKVVFYCIYFTLLSTIIGE